MHFLCASQGIFPRYISASSFHPGTFCDKTLQTVHHLALCCWIDGSSVQTQHWTTRNQKGPWCRPTLRSDKSLGLPYQLPFDDLPSCLDEGDLNRSHLAIYPPKGRWIVVDIYRDAKRRGIYPPLFTDPEGDSCFSIYQIRWIKKPLLQFLLLKLSRNDTPFFSPFAKQWISKDIPSYGSQSKRAKIAIHWFGNGNKFLYFVRTFIEELELGWQYTSSMASLTTESCMKTPCMTLKEKMFAIIYGARRKTNK